MGRRPWPPGPSTICLDTLNPEVSGHAVLVENAVRSPGLETRDMGGGAEAGVAHSRTPTGGQRSESKEQKQRPRSGGMDRGLGGCMYG
jgi:hypothetical protein